MTERLIHWSRSLLTQVDGVEPPANVGPYQKPNGLWVSIEAGGDDGWADWCIREDFGTGGLRKAAEVVLADDANVLWLRTSSDIMNFDQQFQVPVGRPYRPRDGIGWSRVWRQWDGIIIAPYQWSCRMEVDWYYGWDCASGCIWPPRAVKEIRPAPEFDVTEEAIKAGRPAWCTEEAA